MEMANGLENAMTANVTNIDTAFHIDRTFKPGRTLNDHVADLHVMLTGDFRYQRYLRAVSDEEAVEGSLGADNMMAARMIRDKAKAVGDKVVAAEKLATIVKSLGVVLRHYGTSRKQRRNI